MNKEAFVRVVAARCGILLSDAHNLVGALLDSLTEGRYLIAFTDGRACRGRAVPPARRRDAARRPEAGWQAPQSSNRGRGGNPALQGRPVPSLASIPFQSLTTRDIPLYTPPVRIRQGAFFVSLLI